MQDVLNTLNTAHEQLKNLAIQYLQSDQETEQLVVLSAIKSVYALKQLIQECMSFSKIPATPEQATGV